MATQLAEQALSPRMGVGAGPAVHVSERQRDLVEIVRRELREGRLAFVSTECVCGSGQTSVLIANVDRYGLALRSVLCRACGTVRADPYLDDDGLRTFYSNYYQELYARAPDPAAYFEGQADYGRRVLKAIRQIAPCARTAIEIGCGAGGALSVLRDAGFATAGCDHSRELIAFGSARGIDHLVVGGLEDLAGAHRALREVDIVYLHHVFEHLSDPASFLRSCRAVLSNRGVLIAIVPDISRIHAFPFPAGDVRLFLHFAHKYNYSRLGLRMLGTRCGWEVAFLDGFASRNAPELWTVLKPADTPAGGDPAESGGDEMLTYLRQTEARYRFGLLSGYKVGPGGRMQRLAREVLPASVIRWIAAARRMATGSK